VAIGLPVNLRGLVLVKVATETEKHEAVPVLVVAGAIVNDFKRAFEVPRLRFAIRNQHGHEISSRTALPEKNALMAGKHCRSSRGVPRRRASGSRCRCASSTGAISSPESNEGRMARILIAEDEEGLRTLVARALALDGHEVVTAGDGAEALDLLNRAQDSFSLLLTDIRMPIMDGIALARAAARDHPQLGILLMTGYADQRERTGGLESLIHDVITKPFSVGTIRNAVKQAIAAKVHAH